MTVEDIVKAQQGDPKAVQGIQDALKPLVRKLIREYSGSLEAADCWSAAREGITRALKVFDPELVKADPMSIFRVYASGYIRNAYRDVSKNLEENGSREEVSPDPEEGAEYDIPSDDPDPEASYLAQERIAQVQAVIKHLNNQERSLLKVVRGDETAASASRRLDLPEWTVRYRCDALRTKLKMLLCDV